MLLPPLLETPVEDTGIDGEEEDTACGEKHYTYTYTYIQTNVL